MTSKDKIEILSLKSFSSLDLSELFDLKFLEIIKRADTNNTAVIMTISITTKLSELLIILDYYCSLELMLWLQAFQKLVPTSR